MKLLMAFFTELKKKNPKVHMEVTLGRQNRAGGIKIPDLKLYYRAIVTKHSAGRKTDIQISETEQSSQK